jgi:hypothetical protein
MINNSKMRVIILALFVLVCAEFANAHALPGSKLIFSEQQDNTINVKLSFALEDLLIAAPALSSLAYIHAGKLLQGNILNKLNTYLLSQMALKSHAKALPFTLHHSEINLMYNAHVGSFRSVLVEFSAPRYNQGELFPLKLQYDVIMHEVRNHRAVVYWQKNNDSLVKLANFSYKKPTSSPVTYLLDIANTLNLAP